MEASESSSSSTLAEPDSQIRSATRLDTQFLVPFSALPPVYLLSTHLSPDELHEIEEQLTRVNAPLTYDPIEARLFLARLAQKKRAELELRALGVWIDSKPLLCAGDSHLGDTPKVTGKRKRRRKKEQTDISFADGEGSSSTDIEVEDGPEAEERVRTMEETCGISSRLDAIQVIQVHWLEDSLEKDHPLPIKPYLIFEGTRSSKSTSPTASTKSPPPPGERKRARSSSSPSPKGNPKLREGILSRARADGGLEEPAARAYASSSQYPHRQRASRWQRESLHRGPPALVHQSSTDDNSAHELPEMPDWVKENKVFSCERATPMHPPNEAFLDALKTIRLARELTADEIGVRAYSTSIAAIAAYPHTITSPLEILALPGCDTKIASLWSEWRSSDGHLAAAEEAQNDERLKVLKLFYDIWGVGAQTAREFYDKGWRTLDDVVEFGWSSLTRVQQIGVKYYDDFQQPLSRAEVESIAAIVHEHAAAVREPSGVRSCIVGGYRRGKVLSGDVDVIISHMDERATIGIIHDITDALFASGYVTHELKVYTSATRREQATLPVGKGGHGFDTLDKAMVVWQEPGQAGGEDDDGDGNQKQHPHRRVDIIIAPWSKVGCAVLGWTAGTTFERDLRRYCRKVKGWKFDSSGVRDRASGHEVDLESVGGRSTSIDEAEKKVFKGLGLVYREPWERCTG